MKIRFSDERGNIFDFENEVIFELKEENNYSTDEMRKSKELRCIIDEYIFYDYELWKDEINNYYEIKTPCGTKLNTYQLIVEHFGLADAFELYGKTYEKYVEAIADGIVDSIKYNFVKGNNKNRMYIVLKSSDFDVYDEDQGERCFYIEIVSEEKNMTVKELIEHLSKFPMDSQVLATNWMQDNIGDIHYHPIVEVGESWFDEGYVPTLRFDDGMKDGYEFQKNR